MRPLVWFRSDLRTSDNTALAAAARAATRGVVGVFTITPAQWLQHDWAPVKVDLILRTLRDLSDALSCLNIPLKILHLPRFADVPGALLTLARATSCDALHFNDEYEVNERRRDDAVRETFAAASIPVHSYTDQVLIEPGTLRTTEGRSYAVYTPFKRAALNYLQREGAIRIHALPARQPSVPIAADPIPDALPEFTGLTRPDLWPSGERAAADRLAAFSRTAIVRYHETRDIPSIDGTSTLSPYLAIGAISPRQCAAAAVAAETAALDPRPRRRTGPSTWLSEILWREFYKHLLVGFPRVCMHRPFRVETDSIAWRDDPSNLEAWKTGRTGIPIIDAAMRQMLATGWMHNRLRMIAAMFLTKNLLMDWRAGERHFMRHLVDGDLANNNGGWQWSASTGTDSAPYFRVFNPVSQSRTHDPSGAFIRRFLPQLAHLDDDAIHEPWTAPLALTAVDYPAEPLVDVKGSRERAIEAFRALRT